MEKTRILTRYHIPQSDRPGIVPNMLYFILDSCFGGGYIVYVRFQSTNIELPDIVVSRQLLYNPIAQCSTNENIQLILNTPWSVFVLAISYMVALWFCPMRVSNPNALINGVFDQTRYLGDTCLQRQLLEFVRSSSYNTTNAMWLADSCPSITR